MNPRGKGKTTTDFEMLNWRTVRDRMSLYIGRTKSMTWETYLRYNSGSQNRTDSTLKGVAPVTCAEISLSQSIPWFEGHSKIDSEQRKSIRN